MRILVTGSAGHLGEALMRYFEGPNQRWAGQPTEVLGLDAKRSPYTHLVGSVTDMAFVRKACVDVDVVLHAATLHKPHVATHSRQAFLDVNVTGTLNLLEAAHQAGVRAFVYTSTTSTFGDAMASAPGSPAVWVDEQLTAQPKNIYGVSKVAAENLCELFSRNQALPCVVLRTSRFFLEADDDESARTSFSDDNLKVNELLYRRVDIADVVSAHICAIEYARSHAFGRFVISAPNRLHPTDCDLLGRDALSVVRKHYPEFESVYKTKGWAMMPAIGRVYDAQLARRQLGWTPRYDFARAITALQEGTDIFSPLARAIGVKGYHDQAFETVLGDAPYPTDELPSACGE